MKVEFEDEADEKTVMKQVLKTAVKLKMIVIFSFKCGVVI